MSAFTKDFLSHSSGELLREHLVKVADAAEKIMHQTRFESGKLAYYAGLLHDIGKLNPFYQELFHADEKGPTERELESKYERQHALFSAWAAKKLLRSKLGATQLQLVLCAIAYHHSSLSNEVMSETGMPTERRKRARQGLLDNLILFAGKASSDAYFSSFDWKLCTEEFGRPMSFQAKLRSESGDAIKDFVEAGVVFSSLLQADRGSFSERPDVRYDLHLNTGELVNAASQLSKLRTGFQQWFAGVHDFSEPISVLNAPTGMGKTKVFLDLINEYTDRHGIERVMYFSPLLALTEDFESKVANVLTPASLDDILVYNHLFTGRLSSKQQQRQQQEDPPTESYGYNFENESFRSKFIISTTQRLLMTLYFNSVSDKIKLASLRNALLIVDEIQVVPKFLLPNFIGMLRTICREMGARALLVSATIPYELSSNVPVERVPASLLGDYHRLTLKSIKFMPRFGPPAAARGKKIMVMANTRKKARAIFDEVAKAAIDCKLFYVSSGIKKKRRSEIIKEIKEAKSEDGAGVLVISTQVLEAGVDVSFSEVYREVAPLDSIVQVMGRLNREGEAKDPVLHIFQQDLDHRPYSELEYLESLRILKKARNSEELYEKLGGYYERVSAKNVRNADRIAELDRLINDMDFAGVYDFVNRHVFAGQDEHSVIIPETEEDLARISADLKSMKKFDRRTFKAYSALTANLPGSPYKLGVAGYLDSDLLEKGILLPKQGSLEDVYDHRVGLDKWTAKTE